VIRVAILALLLAGCASAPSVPSQLAALHATCDSTCTASCLPDQWPQWECPDPEDAACWDAQPETVALPLRTIALRCETARNACVRCLQRLEDVGALCGVTAKCGD
jgi:hypothetical protein